MIEFLHNYAVVVWQFKVHLLIAAVILVGWSIYERKEVR